MLLIRFNIPALGVWMFFVLSGQKPVHRQVGPGGFVSFAAWILRKYKMAIALALSQALSRWLSVGSLRCLILSKLLMWSHLWVRFPSNLRAPFFPRSRASAVRAEKSLDV